MLHSSHPVMILRATAGADMPEIGMKAGDTFYMARDNSSVGPNARFRIIKWAATRWVCSCGKGQCEHKFQVNEFLFQESEKRRITGDDLTAHIEDDVRSNR